MKKNTVVLKPSAATFATETGKMLRRVFAIAAILLIGSLATFAQQNTAMSPDQTLRSNARVNPSTLGMELSIPLAGYPGRGKSSLPVSLSYSSKVWRMQYNGEVPINNNPENCKSESIPTFSEMSASGWTSSLAVPFIEYTGRDNVY